MQICLAHDAKTYQEMILNHLRYIGGTENTRI